MMDVLAALTVTIGAAAFVLIMVVAFAWALQDRSEEYAELDDDTKRAIRNLYKDDDDDL